MRSSSLGNISALAAAVAAVPAPTAPSPTAAFRLLPWLAGLLLSLTSVGGVLVVQLVVKVPHAHPHEHKERLMWQASILLNLVLTYFALQFVAPAAHLLGQKLGSFLIDVGLFVDYLALGCFAIACLLPVTMLAATADVDVTGGQLTALYLLVTTPLVLNAWLLVRLLRHMQTRLLVP